MLDPKNIVENESDEQKSSSRNNTNRNSRVRESNSCQSNAGGDGLNQSGIFNDFVSANEYVQKVEINDELIEEEFWVNNEGYTHY